MAEKQPWITAFVTAYARAYHATHDSPKIFDDFLAERLFTAEEMKDLDANLASMIEMVDPDLAVAHPDQETALSCVMHINQEPITLSRSRFCEDCLEAAVRQGVSQYVILGAGFDTFAFRRPDLLERLHVFELDHPVTQAIKRERIAAAGWKVPPRLTFVPVDFNTQSLEDVLSGSTFDPARLSFFSWLGVTYYLPREAISATLSAVHRLAGKGSSLVFDCMDRDAFDPAKTSRRMTLMHAVTAQVGEPMLTGFDPQALAGELAQLGFELKENLCPGKLNARYFTGRTDRLRAFENVHLARAVCV